MSWYDFLMGAPPPKNRGMIGGPGTTIGPIRPPTSGPMGPTTIGPAPRRPLPGQTIGPVVPPRRMPLQRFETLPPQMQGMPQNLYDKPAAAPKTPYSLERDPRGWLGNSLLNFFGFGPKEDNVIDVEDIEEIPDIESSPIPGVKGTGLRKNSGTPQTKTGRKPIAGAKEPTKVSQIGVGMEPIPMLPTNTRSKILSSFDPILNYSPTGDDSEQETFNQEEMDDPNSPMNLYKKHLEAFPQRGKTSKWQKFFGALMTAGDMGDPTNAMALMEEPYRRQVTDWSNKEQPLRQLAELDYKFNSPYQMLRNQNIASQISAREAGVGQANRRLDIQSKNAQSRAALAEARIQQMASSGWKAETDETGQLIMYRQNPMSGELEVQPTGIQTMEYLRYQETKRRNSFNQSATSQRLANEGARLKGAEADREQRRKRDEALYGVPAK